MLPETTLSLARVSLDDPGGGSDSVRSTDDVMASASLGDPGGGNELSPPSVGSIGNVMDNVDKDNLGNGSTNGLGSYSNSGTSNNHTAISV